MFLHLMCIHDMKIGIANFQQKALLIVAILYSVTCFCQNETNNWYFGKEAGIHFAEGASDIISTPLTDSSMDTSSGCSSISDYNGNLLFYTNGHTVWGRDHEVMINGGDLAGEATGVQVMIVPNPENENVYYIFYTRETYVVNPNTLYPGIYYSEITFSSEYPNGIVTRKDEWLKTYMSTKLAAVHDYENRCIRVVGFGPSGIQESPDTTFFIFTVSGSGVDPNPVARSSGKTLRAIGQMKISPDGKFIAIADPSADNFLYFFNFDKTTLDISFKGLVIPNQLFTVRELYGVEFTADSKYLYFTTQTALEVSSLWQVALYSEDGILDKIHIFSTPEYGLRALQLARNGKIYVAKTRMRRDREPPVGANHIDVINNPENPADEIDYEEFVDLQGKMSQRGLPSFVASFLRNRIVVEEKCVGDNFNFSVDAYAPVSNATWEFSDGSTSHDLTPVHTFSAVGTHKVKVTVTINNHPVSLYKEVDVKALPNIDGTIVLTQCDPENDGRAYFNLNNVKDKFIDREDPYTFSFYNNIEDAMADANRIVDPEIYQNVSNPEEVFIKMTNKYGCENIASFNIEAVYKTLLPIAPVYACDDSDGVNYDYSGEFDLTSKKQEIIQGQNLPASSVVTLYSNLLDAQAKLNPLEDIITTLSTTLWVRIEDESYDCSGIGTIQLMVAPPVEFSLENRYTICNLQNGGERLDGGIANTRWEWRDTSQNIIVSNAREFYVVRPGNYMLTAYKQYSDIECSLSRSFVVLAPSTVEFNKTIVEDGSISVTLTGTGSYEFSLDNINFTGSGISHVFTGLEAGVYTIYVRDSNSCESGISKQVVLINYDKFFTPNGDGTNDYWRIRNVNKFFKEVSINIYNRYGKFIYHLDVYDNVYSGWDGTLKGSPLPASDYWFTATLVDKDNNVYNKKGHFSLVR
jgi:gliding motility-associated-like protein